MNLILHTLITRAPTLGRVVVKYPGPIDSFTLIVAGYPLTSLSFSVSPIGSLPVALLNPPAGLVDWILWWTAAAAEKTCMCALACLRRVQLGLCIGGKNNKYRSHRGVTSGERISKERDVISAPLNLFCNFV